MAGSRRQWIGLLAAYSFLAAFFAMSLKFELRRFPLGAGPAVSLYACLLLLFAFWLAPGFAVSRGWLASRLRGTKRAASCAGLFLVPYLVYAAGTGDFRWPAIAKLAIFAFLPFVLYAALPIKDPQCLHWQDLIILIWLGLPVFAGKMRGVWNVPLNLDFMARVFIVAVGAWAVLIWRGLEGAGYEFRCSRPILRAALINLLGFSVIAIPVGFAIDFIAWRPRWHGPWSFAFDLLTIFLFIAISEELYFRGVIQNLLESTWRSRYGGQAAASLLFGFSHIQHAPFPNWRYVILASIAGWFYGTAYRQTRSLMASAATHALVDAIWRTWFTLLRT
jgi:membrane protease YdiL (CAAX protease family)